MGAEAGRPESAYRVTPLTEPAVGRGDEHAERADRAHPHRVGGPAGHLVVDDQQLRVTLAAEGDGGSLASTQVPHRLRGLRFRR